MQVVLDHILIVSWCIVGWLSQFNTFLESCLPRQVRVSFSRRAFNHHCRTENMVPRCLTDAKRNDHSDKALQAL